MLNHGANIAIWKKELGLSGRRIIDFSANINPFGPPSAIKGLLRGDIGLFARYPQDYSQAAAEKIAEFCGINKDNLLITNGSIEGIYLAARFLANKPALIVEPAFSEYEKAVKSNGGRCVHFNTASRNGFQVNIGHLIKKLPGMGALFICNPNNPTGQLIAKDDLLFLTKKCASFGVALVIDEAFIDFLPQTRRVSMLGSCQKHSNIIILGSFTKFFALAGLRLGYIAAHRNLIKKAAKLCFPWAVNSLAQAAASALVSENAYIKRTHAFIAKEKEFLFKELSKISALTVFAPSVNFILCSINDKQINSGSLFKKLAQQGIFIRDCSNFRGLNNSYFRVAVRTRKENIKLISVLRHIFNLFHPPPRWNRLN